MTKLSSILTTFCFLLLVASCPAQWQVGNRNFAPPISAAVTVTAITQVNSWSDIVISNEAVPEVLGWTTAIGDFLVVEVCGGAGTTISGVTAYAGTTAYPMTVAVSYITGRSPVILFYLANTPAINTITVALDSSNGSNLAINVVEYTGLSASASPTSTAVTVDSGFTGATTWSIGPYTVPAGSLVLAGSVSSAYGSGGTWGADGDWSVVDGSSGNNLGLALLEDIDPAGGALTATGTYSLGSNYGYYDSFIVAFK